MKTELHKDRTILKLGSKVVVDNDTNMLYHKELKNIIDDMIEVRDQFGVHTALISSGAVGVGRHETMEAEPLEVSEDELAEWKQDMASVGQGLLMEYYNGLLRDHNSHAAQILVHQGDIAHRKDQIQRRILRALHSKRIPIINENDALANEEIKFGDNDGLARSIAEIISVNKAIFLSRIDGFIEDYPNGNLVSIIRSNRIKELEANIRAAEGNGTRGGMESKFNNGVELLNNGVISAIADGHKKGIYKALSEVMQGILNQDKYAVQRLNDEKLGTIFVPDSISFVGETTTFVSMS